MKLAFTLAAQSDLIEISDFIAQRNPARAMSYIDELEFQCRRMAEHPLSYHEHRKVPASGEWCLGVTWCFIGLILIAFWFYGFWRASEILTFRIFVGLSIEQNPALWSFAIGTLPSSC